MLAAVSSRYSSGDLLQVRVEVLELTGGNHIQLLALLAQVPNRDDALTNEPAVSGICFSCRTS